MNVRQFVLVMLFPLLVLALAACMGEPLPNSGDPFALSTPTPYPLAGYNQEPANSAGLATLAAGQNKIMELSHQATAISLGQNQAANAAAQATVDYYQRQLMELSVQGTQVSQNMERASATQQFITEQTQAGLNATATAWSRVATATYSAYALNVTQTAQVQSILAIQANQKAQANATQAAHSLTATPFAAIQSEIVRARNESDRRALWDEFIVTPSKFILITLVVILLIVGGILAYQRLMPVLELRLRTIWQRDDSNLVLVDGVIVDLEPPHPQIWEQELRPLTKPGLPRMVIPQVDIVEPYDPSVTNWITEAEQKLRSGGRIQE